MKETFEGFYQDALKKPPFDVQSNPRGFPYREPPAASCQSALMPALQYFASLCETVTEFGVREGYSTAAFAKGLSLNRKDKQLLVSVDIQKWPVHGFFRQVGLPCQWELVYADIINGLSIDDTDLLHIDDLHTYNQVRRELELHGHKAKRFLSFHDTYSQGLHSLDCPGQEGICRVILEYTLTNGFAPVYQVDFNHGLWVFEKQP